MADRIINEALSNPEPDPQGKKRKRGEEDWVDIINKQDGEEEEDMLGLCNLGEKKRFLIRSINALRRTNPEAFERAVNFATDEHSQLPEAELRIMHEILREETGMSNPYDNSQAITSLAGNLMERFFKLDGLGTILSTDMEIVSLVQDFLPQGIQKLGGFAKLVDRVMTAVAAQYAQKNDLQRPWMMGPDPSLSRPTPQNTTTPSVSTPIPTSLASHSIPTETPVRQQTNAPIPTNKHGKDIVPNVGKK